MKIAIIGYGRMGKQVQKAALNNNDEVVAIIDNENDWLKKSAQLKSADAAIEFTTPDTVVENILKCFELNIPVITGTTGWDNDFEMVKQKCIQQNQCLFTASNFSIGVHLFFWLNRNFAGIINHINDYDISVEEIHHTGKKDKPSGTALELLKLLIDKIERKQAWTFNANPESSQIQVNSIREGDVFGTHQVEFTSDDDTIGIKHTARGRQGFARGAIAAAHLVAEKKGVFNMDDLLQF